MDGQLELIIATGNLTDLISLDVDLACFQTSLEVLVCRVPTRHLVITESCAGRARDIT
jgi:hypothetical protein